MTELSKAKTGGKPLNTLLHQINLKLIYHHSSIMEQYVSDGNEKANVLNDFFHQQTLLDDTNTDIPPLPDLDHINKLDTINITPNEVGKVLKSLKLGKACGNDGINNKVLKELHEELSIPLSTLFNHSIEHAIMPTKWKEANVTPIFKKRRPIRHGKL